MEKVEQHTSSVLQWMTTLKKILTRHLYKIRETHILCNTCKEQNIWADRPQVRRLSKENRCQRCCGTFKTFPETACNEDHAYTSSVASCHTLQTPCHRCKNFPQMSGLSSSSSMANQRQKVYSSSDWASGRFRAAALGSDTRPPRYPKGSYKLPKTFFTPTTDRILVSLIWYLPHTCVSGSFHNPRKTEKNCQEEAHRDHTAWWRYRSTCM